MQEVTQVVRGLDLFARVWQNGHQRNIIMVHGIGVSGRYMVPLAVQLSLSFNVYVLDLPGFGKSEKLPKASIYRYAQQLNDYILLNSISKPILLGNSFGCQVCIEVVRQNPDLVSSAIFIGPTINIYDRSYLKVIIKWLQNLKNEPTLNFAAIVLLDILECGPLLVFKTLKQALADKPEDKISEIKSPILLVRGSKDPIAPLSWLKYLADKNKRIIIKELLNAGHAVNFNSPKPMARLIKDFLRV